MQASQQIACGSETGQVPICLKKFPHISQLLQAEVCTDASCTHWRGSAAGAA